MQKDLSLKKWFSMLLALAMIIMLASMTWMSVRADSVPFKDVPG